jgi:hypothetical protein
VSKPKSNPGVLDRAGGGIRGPGGGPDCGYCGPGGMPGVNDLGGPYASGRGPGVYERSLVMVSARPNGGGSGRPLFIVSVRDIGAFDLPGGTLSPCAPGVNGLPLPIVSDRDMGVNGRFISCIGGPRPGPIPGPGRGGPNDALDSCRPRAGGGAVGGRLTSPA